MISYETDPLSPIPINDNVLENAFRLKKLGLPWSPQVGCFVWDREAVIPAPSPFPQRVYFILSMRRFKDIFGCEEKMKRQLVWVPTWHQAFQLCRRLGVTDFQTDYFFDGKGFTSGEDGLLQLYALVARQLEASGRDTSAGNRVDDDSTTKRWIRRVMEAELGSLAHLPQAVQRRVQSVYDEAGMAYLGWRRIQEQQPADWVPPETTFDARLLDDLSHFYSDYQNLIKSMTAIRERVKRIRDIDPVKEPDRFEQLVKQFLNGHVPGSETGQILAYLSGQD